MYNHWFRNFKKICQKIKDVFRDTYIYTQKCVQICIYGMYSNQMIKCSDTTYMVRQRDRMTHALLFYYVFCIPFQLFIYSDINICA